MDLLSNTRNEIRKIIQDAHAILEEEMERILGSVFGIYRDGNIEDVSSMRYIQDSRKAINAREDFAHFLEREFVLGNTKPDAVQRLIMSLAFTNLNRLVALKLMEKRRLIKETLSRSTRSDGFAHYISDALGKTELSQIDNIDAVYRDFILHQCREFGEEIKVLFDPEDSSYHAFPGPKALNEILEIINSEDSADIWDADENIGWFYQYFSPKKPRQQTEVGRPSPRNYWELEFRNQFYTPRYTVQFLGDNTLGRIWYEMMQADTRLSQICRYMVKPQREMFLQNSEKPSSGDNNLQIPFRQKKDPRELNILDPACGSGHFLLYIFDLLMIIYEESYTDRDSKLRKDYPDRAEFEREIPRLIIENNLFGMDIDLRAVQIAALVLWLRSQREWEKMGIPGKNRPRIRVSYFVCADPMKAQTGLCIPISGNQRFCGDFIATMKPSLFGKMIS